ncbi:retrotransposon-like protein 1 [Engraulis encrasicolus]|uniref:retrotransposon-like protein 1 n=1 Tax=Engraulis encrasicolus TaxID=184585 RepID=UPI002FD4B84F
MEESTFETFEDELGSPLQEAPTPPKPIRQARRPEMYAQQRRMREDAAIPQQVPKTIPREPSTSRTNAVSGLRKALSMQSLAQVEVPFQGVTLNRCLFIAITILVITSGCQRLNETLRGRKDTVEEEEESALSLRHGGLKKHQPEPEPETSLWDTFFWWMDDDDDDDAKGRGRKKRAAQEKSSRSLRHKHLEGRSLLRKSEGRLSDRRKKRSRGEEEEDEGRVRGKRELKKRAKKLEEEEEEEEDEEEEEEEEDDELDDEEEEKPKKTKKAKDAKEKQTKPKGKEKRKKNM